MLRRTFITLAATTAALTALPTLAQDPSGETTMSEPQTGFAPINGLEMYYEIHGRGEPLLMLHGGIGATEHFGPNIAELAKTRQVIVAHMQGHGFTRDIDRPYSYMQLGDDVAALIDHLGLGSVDLLGYSMGANVAQRTAIQHPEKIRRLILVSGSMAHDGSYPEVIAAFPAMVENAAQIGANVAANSPLAGMYPDVDWETAFRKMGEMQREPWDWSGEIDAITAPVQLIFADADSVRGEHMVAMYQKFGGFQRDAGLDGSLRATSRLAIIPGRTHYNILETTEASEIVGKFLAEVVAS